MGLKETGNLFSSHGMKVRVRSMPLGGSHVFHSDMETPRLRKPSGFFLALG